MNNETEDLVFQCKDILSRDIRDGADTDSTDSGSSGGRAFQIILFGTTAKGTTVTLAVSGFRPFFYVRLPNCLSVDQPARAQFKAWVLNAVPDHAAKGTSIVYEQHKTLFDYNAGALGTFAKITVPSMAMWRQLKDRFLTKTTTPIEWETASLLGSSAIKTLLKAPKEDDIYSLSDDGKRIGLKVYEANIDPVLRWFHIQDVSPSGWVCVPAGFWDENTDNDASTTISATTDSESVKPGPAAAVAPFLVASWDIECNSSHGDFPIANKTWRKPLRDIFEVSAPQTLEDLAAALKDAVTNNDVFLRNPSSDKNFALMFEVKKKEIQTALLAMNGATNKTRDELLTKLDDLVTSVLPTVAGDEIIQIGTVLYKLGAPVSKHIWVLGDCNRDAVRPPGADVPIHVYVFHTEIAMLKAWITWIGEVSPDVLVGYNIFGFDSKYIYDRMKTFISKFELKKALAPLSCLGSRPPKLEEKFLSSSAMGDNTMYFLGSAGRLQIDLLPYIRRNHNLDSYKLDNVSATFVSGGLKDLVCVDGGETYRFKTKSTKGIVVGRYLTLMDEENDRVVEKCAVIGVEPNALLVTIEGGAQTLEDHGIAPVRWAQVKDDVSPKDIFRLHRGSADDRAIIARYCLQDCDLVMELFNKLEVLNNSIAMASVCSVPVSFIFLRGQGIKAESLIFKECRKVDQLIEVMSSPARNFGGGPVEEVEEVETPEGAEAAEAEESYEGAIVLEPHTGIYLDDPVTADDFASLYPSSIISENISHDTLIWVKDYDQNGNVKIREGSEKYDNLPGAKYVNIEFDILRTDPEDTRKNPTKFRDGRRIARYIQQPQGTIPRILEMLLSSRKKTRKLAEAEPDEFRKALLDAQQLAYKLTANSLYGQLGSPTFKIRRQVLAASTTAYGRKQLLYAKEVIERLYGGGADPRCDVECVYGDTDSIFLRFRPKDPVTGERLKGQAALQAAKDLTIESGKLVSSCLKAPHDFEFDKIFKSFILLSKKRYVGDMSEDGLEPGDFHRKSMGIVMKRRDNAPIVKYVYGGAIERILTTSDVKSGVQEAAKFVTQAAKDLLEGKFGLHKLTITKSLRAEYADPLRIAHKVLADRIAQRDPGNKPSTSDRIPFVYISSGAGPAPALQGDRIELPSYIVEHKLAPDYAFYITNQIAKPVSQVFGLAVEAFCAPNDVAAANHAKDPVAAREACAQTALFKKALVEAARAPARMEAKGQRSIATMFRTS
jgi:DNA polymerase elongation subunit (family B)